MNSAQTMAKWEPQHYVSTEMGGGPAAAYWARDERGFLTPNCGQLDSCSR